MTTIGRHRDREIAAYVGTGKGADLAGHWHEMAGTNEDLAELIPAAMHLTDQIEAAILPPPYRT